MFIELTLSILKKNVPWHILAPRAIACDNQYLRTSAIQMARAIADSSLQLRASTFLLFYKIMVYSIRSNAIRGVPSGT